MSLKARDYTRGYASELAEASELVRRNVCLLRAACNGGAKLYILQTRRAVVRSGAADYDPIFLHDERHAPLWCLVLPPSSVKDLNQTEHRSQLVAH
eukprot:6176007-Pleurochrysis_carterae.AAC.1